MMDPNWIGAIAGAASAAATIALVLVAFVQLKRLREQIDMAAQQDLRRITLDACQRYEKDPELRSAMRNIRQATSQGSDYTLLSAENSFDAFTILNYLDALACGILQGVYIEALVKDHMRDTIEKAVKALIKGESGPGWKAEKGMVEPSRVSSLLTVYEKWFPLKKIEYHEKPTSKSTSPRQ